MFDDCNIFQGETDGRDVARPTAHDGRIATPGTVGAPRVSLRNSDDFAQMRSVHSLRQRGQSQSVAAAPDQAWAALIDAKLGVGRCLPRRKAPGVPFDGAAAGPSPRRSSRPSRAKCRGTAATKLCAGSTCLLDHRLAEAGARHLRRAVHQPREVVGTTFFDGSPSPSS